MAQQLVTDILCDSDNSDNAKLVTMVTHRLWCVHGSAVVSDVLGRVEHPEGQAGQEVSGRQETSDRSQLEPSHT